MNSELGGFIDMTLQLIDAEIENVGKEEANYYNLGRIAAYSNVSNFLMRNRLSNLRATWHESNSKPHEYEEVVQNDAGN